VRWGPTSTWPTPSATTWGHRRVKNDERDATDLVDLLRLGRLAEAWIAPPAVRELREIVRYRARLVALRSGLKSQVHAVLAKEGVKVPMSDLFGVAGHALLDTVPLGRAYELRVESLRDLIELYDREVAMLDREVARALAGDGGYRAIQAIPGVGPILGAVFVAEMGDVTRFDGPDKLASWAGRTPRHRESDTTVQRGHITKQGSRLVRWAAVEAVQRQRGGTKLQADYRRIAERRGRKIGVVAAARKLLALVYWGLRDGEIRCLATGEGEGRAQPGREFVVCHGSPPQGVAEGLIEPVLVAVEELHAASRGEGMTGTRFLGAAPDQRNWPLEQIRNASPSESSS